MKEIEIINHLAFWMRGRFSDSDLLIESEVSMQLGEDSAQFKVDLLAIQSKSNVIHAFEVKEKVNERHISSIMWQVDSMYANYKWLVIGEASKQFFMEELLREKGIGLIVYDIARRQKPDFHVIVSSKYIDGNMLKYYPNVNKKWLEKIKDGRYSRPKKKN